MQHSVLDNKEGLGIFHPYLIVGEEGVRKGAGLQEPKLYKQMIESGHGGIELRLAATGETAQSERPIPSS